MPRPGWILLPAILLVALHPRAQTPAARPLFRGGTDLVQVDVSVLDSKRHPVRGLTAADFTVLEDGRPREIQAFSEVYLPDRVRAEAAPWVRDVASDVVSNQIAEDEGRLVMILLDRSIPLGEPTLVAKRIATAAVSQLGPGDPVNAARRGAGTVAFANSDRLLGFLRIYQGTSRKDPLLPVQLQSSVIDAQGRVVAKESARLDAAQFEKGRSADHYFALPLVGLAPGEYLLRIETEMGPRVAGRALRFSVN
jgi:hypothetical protein